MVFRYLKLNTSDTKALLQQINTIDTELAMTNSLELENNRLIKKILKQLNITEEKLAKELRVTKEEMAEWKKGKERGKRKGWKSQNIDK